MIGAQSRIRLPALPSLPLRWGAGAVTAAQVSALSLPLLVALAERGVEVFLVALVASGLAEAAFAMLRGRGASWHGIPTAMTVAVMAPEGLPAWQAAVAVVSGVVLADLVFGGRGFGFLSAAVASLAFLVFSFPNVALAGGDYWTAVATLPGAALLLVTGLISWRVLVAAGVAILAVGMVQGGLGEAAVALTFGVVFLTADPVGAAATNPGRWVYGALAGWLALSFAGGEVAALPTSLVFATLLASIFAPLFDHLAVIWTARRLHHE